MPNGIKKNQINNIINYGLENLNDLEEWSRMKLLRNLIFKFFKYHKDTSYAKRTRVL